jgi:hypothetical protein
MRSAPCILICALATLPWHTSHAASELSTSQESLVGIKNLRVLVEGLDEDEQRAGLTQDDIRVRVELALRRAGVPVANASSRSPYIYVNVHCILISDSNSIACSVNVELHATAIVEATGHKAYGASIWNAGSLGFAGQSKVLNGVNETVDQLMIRFLNDYLAANPVTR